MDSPPPPHPSPIGDRWPCEHESSIKAGATRSGYTSDFAVDRFLFLYRCAFLLSLLSPPSISLPCSSVSFCLLAFFTGELSVSEYILAFRVAGFALHCVIQYAKLHDREKCGLWTDVVLLHAHSLHTYMQAGRSMPASAVLLSKANIGWSPMRPSC